MTAMTNIILDGQRLAALAQGEDRQSRQELHGYLAEKLGLPAYYGRNLDALYDLLTEGGERQVVLIHSQYLEAAAGYGQKLLITLREAAAANPGLGLEIRPD